ncbi:MAG TPA: hypothetical protein VJR92_09415 [Gemmatimonadaceae bacterium]|nr:hypothetical protein [Gemmatimonadaceae bacterium]
MRLRSIVLAFVVPLVTVAAVRAPRTQAPRQVRTVCTCSDLVTLVNRLNMAQAAAEVLYAQVAQIEAAQRAAGREFMMDERNASGQSNYDQIAATINEAMSSVQMAGVKTGGGKTDAKCKMTVDADGTPCLNEVIAAHEQDVHVDACKAEEKAGAFTVLGNRPVATAVAYAKEEIRGYEREMAKIREILRSLPPECQSEWVGFIYFYEKNALATTITLGPSNTRVSGTQTTKSDFTRAARFLFRSNGTPLLNVRAGKIDEMGSTGVAKTQCRGGLAGSMGAERTVYTTSSTKNEISAFTEADAEASFSFDSTTGSYSLSIRVPDSQGTGTTISSLRVRGSCDPAHDVTNGGTASLSEPFAGTSIAVDDSTAKSAIQIRGEKTFDWSPSAMPPGVTHSHTGRITWILYRVP